MHIGDFGQPRLERLLDEMLARGRVSGSFIFEGPAGTGKEALAVELGRLLNCERGGACPPRPLFLRGKPMPAASPPCSSCHKFDILQHPDLTLVFPVPVDTWEKETPVVTKILAAKAADPYSRPDDWDRPTSIQAAMLRDIVMPAVYSRPVEARVKTVVLSDADQMAPHIGNLMLKTLEEPPADCLLVLTTTVPERLLPTILSRCQRLRFTALPAEWIESRLQMQGADPSQARLAASVAQGSMLAASRFLRGELGEARDKVFEVLRAVASGDLLRLLELAQALAAEKKERRMFLPLFVQLLEAGARDLLLATEGVQPQAARSQRGGIAGPQPIHADRWAEVQELARDISSEAARRMVRQIESSERQLAGSAHAEMTLATLFASLAAHVAAARPATAGRAT